SSTLTALSNAGIEYMGAGFNLQDAQTPARIALPNSKSNKTIAFHSSFQWSNRYDSEYKFYAGTTTPGTANLNNESIQTSLITTHTFHVAFPHCGKNYSWRTDKQRSLAHSLLNRGFSTVIGHGAHCLQEIEFHKNKWISYGLGNGIFIANGRFDKFVRRNNIFPMSFWSILEVTRQRAKLNFSLK